MLYNLDSSIRNVKKRIEGLEQEGNAEIILKFLEKLFSEGISKQRVLKYGNHLKVISERMGKSFSEVDEEDIVRYLSQLEQSDYSEYTKRDFKVVLKRFFRYLGKEELTEDIKTTVRNSRKKLPDELLTEADVKKIVDTADHPRDKAIIGTLYEGGLRVGELASLKIKNIEFDDDGAVIKVRGKTGERRVRLVSFASTVAAWLEMHPRRHDKEAPLWVNLSTNYKKEGITYEGLSQKIKRIAKKAGIKKNINPHLFRHSRATHLAKDLTEAQMNVYFGWVQGSNMPATYVHLSGRDVDEKILQIHGLKPKDKHKESTLKPQVCPRCKYINSPVSRFCGRCGTLLDEEERMKSEMQSRQVAKDFPDLSIGEVETLERMKKFRDMLELFEKNPGLLKTLRAMAEEI
jgi:site-specific recombinase XerD